jgi:hypothetical protein
MAARSLSKRNLLRAQERRAAKLHKGQEQLFRAQVGGSAQRPLEVASASVIESRAADVRCPRCDLPLRIEEHLARTLDGQRLRELITSCAECGQLRSLWFQLVPRLH